MSERIFLSTFVVKVLDRDKHELILSRFNEAEDFFNTFRQFTEEIFVNMERQSDVNNTAILHLTLDSPATVIETERKIYGYFSSGISGEKFNIRDINTNETEMEVIPDRHGSFREIFFYLVVPIGRSIGYLILQRKSKFGIKTNLKKSLNRYIHDLGFTNCTVEINNLLNSHVYERMMHNGSLKKVDFIKRRIPNSIEQYINNNGNTFNTNGTMRVSISANSGLSDRWKDFVSNHFGNHNANTRIEIGGVDGELDEMEFELELNGKKKTFHVVNQQRTQPDIDVTSNLVFENNEPTIASLISESQSLIDDMLEVRINHD